jgi:hypothetical protein
MPIKSRKKNIKRKYSKRRPISKKRVRTKRRLRGGAGQEPKSHILTSGNYNAIIKITERYDYSNLFKLIKNAYETNFEFYNGYKKFKASIKEVVITSNKITYTGMILTLTVQPLIPVTSGGRKVSIPDETRQYDVNILITENLVFFVENNNNKKFKINTSNFRKIKTQFTISDIIKNESLTEEERAPLIEKAKAQLITEAIAQREEDLKRQLTTEERTQLTGQVHSQLIEEERTLLTDETLQLIALLNRLDVYITPFLYLKNIINFWLLQMSYIIEDENKKKHFMEYINKYNPSPIFT